MRGRMMPWDARIRGYLVIGFLVFCALGMTIIVMGFAVQDRLALSGAATVRQVGVITFLSGVTMIAVQGFAVPRLGWAPLRLLSTGAPVASLGLLGLAYAGSFWTLALALSVMSLGLALAIPGYTAGASLQVGAAEQGSVSGLVNATNGLTFVVGPVAGTALYQIDGALPMLVASAMCLLASLLLWADRQGRRRSSQPGVAAR